MQRAHKIRIYPNKQQEIRLRQAVGTARFVYNWALDTWNKWYDDYKNGVVPDKPNHVKLSKLWTSVRPEWSKAIARCCQDRAIKNVAYAFTMYFNKVFSKPVFHKKNKSKNSFYVDNFHGWITEDANHVHLPMVGDVRLAEALRLRGKIVSYTVSEYADKWYVSIVINVQDDRKAINSTCGIDVGIKTPAVCSDGTRLILPSDKLHDLNKRLKKLQRKCDKRRPGSKRRLKALIHLRRVREKFNNIKKDCIHKFTTTVCKNHATVVVEDMDCQSLHIDSPKPIRSGISRISLAVILKTLEYKAINCIKADKWYPSTQLCSKCGARKKLSLTDRVYNCPNCGLSVDRDLNAAINLSHYPGSLG